MSEENWLSSAGIEKEPLTGLFPTMERKCFPKPAILGKQGRLQMSPWPQDGASPSVTAPPTPTPALAKPPREEPKVKLNPIISCAPTAAPPSHRTRFKVFLVFVKKTGVWEPAKRRREDGKRLCQQPLVEVLMTDQQVCDTSRGGDEHPTSGQAPKGSPKGIPGQRVARGRSRGSSSSRKHSEGEAGSTRSLLGQSPALPRAHPDPPPKPLWLL